MAIKNTKKIGCRIDPLKKRLNKMNGGDIVNLFAKYLLHFNFDLCKDVCGNCLYRHIDFQKFLKYYNINSVLTIGDVLVENKFRYNTSLQYLRDQLAIGIDNKAVFNAHVWLTSESFEVIDVVLQSSRFCNKEIDIECYHDELVIIDQAATGFKYEYKPLIVGRDYLDRTHKIEIN